MLVSLFRGRESQSWNCMQVLKVAFLKHTKVPAAAHELFVLGNTFSRCNNEVRDHYSLKLSLLSL